MEASSATYINSMIIGVCTMVAYLSGGLLVNTIGKRKLSALSLIVSSISSILLYWTVSMTETVTLFSIFVSMGSLSGSVLAGIVVDMFPTSIRYEVNL